MHEVEGQDLLKTGLGFPVGEGVLWRGFCGRGSCVSGTGGLHAGFSLLEQTWDGLIHSSRY